MMRVAWETYLEKEAKHNKKEYIISFHFIYVGWSLYAEKSTHDMRSTHMYDVFAIYSFKASKNLFYIMCLLLLMLSVVVSICYILLIYILRSLYLLSFSNVYNDIPLSFRAATTIRRTISFPCGFQLDNLPGFPNESERWISRGQ